MKWSLFAFLLVSLEQTRGQGCSTRGFDCPVSLKYPTFDGSCNNIGNPLWGAGGTVQLRLLSAEYGPGDSPRGSNNIPPLPTARAVSNALQGSSKTNTFSGVVSNLHVLWGQFLSHDISQTPMTKNGSEDLDCNCLNPHPECANIPIGDDDVQRVEKECFSLPRSRMAVGLGCEIPQREQVNELSSFIDATQVYGKTLDASNALRDPDKPGHLLSQDPVLNTRHRLLPDQDDITDEKLANSIQCPVRVHIPVGEPCFVAGDVRLNENTGLMAIHTVWMRYHNEIAKLLKSLNNRWSSDTVYNEARMIVIALMQIITYREYLPPLLGLKLMKKYKLNLRNKGYWNGYDPRLNPSVGNAFSTAAFRYGHSMLRDAMTRRRANFNIMSELGLQESFVNSEPLLESKMQGVGGFMRGFMADEAAEMDSFFAHDVRNELTKEFGNEFGGDLVAFNVQRGRDHGLPGYNEYRELCGFGRATIFQDLSGEINFEEREKLRSVYNSVNDIDLYAGGVAERRVSGGQVGPTFACLLGIDFRALRRGDRFWHEHKHSPTKFTIAQLSALRKISFASVLCRVSEFMKDTKEKPMLQDSRMVSCDEVASLDLSPWDDGEEKHT